MYEKPIMRENITEKVTFNESHTEEQKKEEETKMEEKNEQIKPTKNTEQEKLLNEEEANIFIKQHFKRELVRENEILNEQKNLICKFFAYDIPCPDLKEFGECIYQHDEVVKEAHEYYIRKKKNPENEGEIANLAI